MHERIRRRREEREIAGYALAARLGISPSYVSLIEGGKKIPGEVIARKIAEVLDDDPEIYAAWAHSARVEDLGGYTDRLLKLRRYSSDPALRRQLRSGEDIDERLAASEEPARVMATFRSLDSKRSLASRALGLFGSSDPGLAAVPWLRAGTDPATAVGTGHVAGPPLRLDARLFEGSDLSHLFAYAATAELAARVADAVRAGDWLVLSTRVAALDGRTIYAVRLPGGIILGRLIVKGSELLVLPAPGAGEIEVVERPGGSDLSRAVAGRVVLTIR